MSSNSVKEFILREVPDWDDEVIATARFKAFSGQRSDWEPKFHFWRDLILNVSRQFGLLIVHASQVKNLWFDRGGLTPLCIDHVLSVMYDEGAIMRIGDLEDPASGRLSRLFRKMRSLMVRSTMTAENILDDKLVIVPMLKEKAAEVVKILSEGQWNSSRIVTMKMLSSMCGGSDEASAVLSYLSGCGKAQYLSVRKRDFIEGVKVSLSQAAVSSILGLDCDILHLLWTSEKLQEQLEVIAQRYEASRNSALASLKSGNKKVALRHARELKLATESRERYTNLLNRVEEILNVIADSESTKKVSEAIKIGARAMKENKISAEEVHVCLEELEETIESQKQVEKALDSTPYPDIEDEDIEDEFMKLEMELESESSQDKAAISESAESLSDAFLNLKLATDSTKQHAVQEITEPVKNQASKTPILEVT